MGVNIEAQKNRRVLERVKWLFVVILLSVAVIGNHYYRNYHLLIRALIIILIVAIASSIAMMTNKGKFAITFARDAYTEVHKIIWPTRQETLHTTLIVTVMIAVTSLILWGLDIILVRVVSFFTSLRF